uniref:Uncharacterized protein n=1 Tax=Tanacetum cinerariifolium TaxID=118510 RepID=A0A699JJP0_TANCI|nr:hypothetical protein [Tanacetum cinerariifolium]
MKESKAYTTYLGYATGTVPPKVARKFKKASLSKKDSVPVPADEELVQKGKRVKRSAKKSSTTPTTSIIIREAPVETQSKRKEKMDVAHGKGIDLLFEYHPSGSSLVAKKPPSVEKITPPVTSEGTGLFGPQGLHCEHKNDSKEHELDSEQGTDGSESGSKFDQQDDDEVKENDNDDDKSEGDEDKGINSDDVQDKKADSTPSPLPKNETTNIPPSILDFDSVFRFNDRVIALEKDAAELKNDPLHTQVTTLVDDHLDTSMGATREEFMNFLSASLTDRITEQVRN